MDVLFSILEHIGVTVYSRKVKLKRCDKFSTMMINNKNQKQACIKLQRAAHEQSHHSTQNFIYAKFINSLQSVRIKVNKKKDYLSIKTHLCWTVFPKMKCTFPLDTNDVRLVQPLSLWKSLDFRDIFPFRAETWI